MIDPVSEELIRRARLPLSWTWACVAALGLHLVVLTLLLIASKPKSQALTLPAIRVRLAASPELPQGHLAPQAPSLVGKPSTPAVVNEASTRKTLPKNSQKNQKKKAAPTSKDTISQGGNKREYPRQQPPLGPAAVGPNTNPTGKVIAGGSGLALGASEGPPFPYDYYLRLVLASIEQNWFKPAAAPGTRCRVRCRISRSGQVQEASLEEASTNGAFDRAALRAVYAAAPFPPLPQGFPNYELILHLEFVQ